MKRILKLLLVLVCTFLLLFATSFLLDLPIIYSNGVRIALVLILLVVELAIGVRLYLSLSASING